MITGRLLLRLTTEGKLSLELCAEVTRGLGKAEMLGRFPLQAAVSSEQAACLVAEMPLQREQIRQGAINARQKSGWH